MQVDRNKTCVETWNRLWFLRLKLLYDETLSIFAFNFSMRRYTEGYAARARDRMMVRRCRFNR